MQDARTRSQSVADTLRERILRGDFAPGARMQEIALAEELHVSRTPIREALRSLVYRSRYPDFVPGSRGHGRVGLPVAGGARTE
jgi:DNA-binding transcriptional MocR family regulator